MKSLESRGARFGAMLLVLWLGVGVVGCNSLLDVENPNRVVGDDVRVSTAAQAVANGALYEVQAGYTYMLMVYSTTTDELEWCGSRDAYEELDYGWIEYLTCYSYSNNTDADGEARVNINQAGRNSLQESLGISRAHAQWIVDNRSFSSIGDLINNNSPKEPQEGNSNSAQPLDLQTFASIADYITVDNSDKQEGLVNINTASDFVLAALFGGGDGGLQLAEDIITLREEQLYGMESVADVLRDGGMSVSDFKKIADLITVRSDVYTIRSTAAAVRPSGTGFAHFQ